MILKEQNNTSVQRPKLSSTYSKSKDNVCDTCAKEDVCKLKEELGNVCRDILLIQEKTNDFVETSIKCKKYFYNAPTYNTR